MNKLFCLYWRCCIFYLFIFFTFYLNKCKIQNIFFLFYFFFLNFFSLLHSFEQFWFKFGKNHVKITMYKSTCVHKLSAIFPLFNIFVRSFTDIYSFFFFVGLYSYTTGTISKAVYFTTQKISTTKNQQVWWSLAKNREKDLWSLVHLTM